MYIFNHLISWNILETYILINNLLTTRYIYKDKQVNTEKKTKILSPFKT